MAFKIESSLLDACALAILHRGDTYGYEITQEMKKSITVSESTLYPVLRRLQQEHLCQTYDQPYQGRNRRYYRITEKGEEQLRDYMKQWNDYRNAIQRLLDGPEAESVKAEEKADSAESAPADEEPGEKAAKGKKGAEEKQEEKPKAKKSEKKKVKDSRTEKDKGKEDTEGGAADE